MDNIGEVISACFALRYELNLGMLPAGDRRYGVLLSKEEAEKIHANTVSIAPGKDEIQVAWTRRSKGELIVEKSIIPKPHHPEAGQEWFRVFDIPVIVVDC